jgi:hypothetical protein
MSEVCYFHLWVSLVPASLWKVWFSSFSFKLLFLLDLGSKLAMSYGEFLCEQDLLFPFVSFSYFCKSCERYDFLPLVLSSCLDLGNKLPMNFCEFLWDIMWVQIFCAMHIVVWACQIRIRNYLFMCFLHLQMLSQVWIINAFIFLQKCFFSFMLFSQLVMLRKNLQFDSILSVMKWL